MPFFVEILLPVLLKETDTGIFYVKYFRSTGTLLVRYGTIQVQNNLSQHRYLYLTVRYGTFDE